MNADKSEEGRNRFLSVPLRILLAAKSSCFLIRVRPRKSAAGFHRRKSGDKAPHSKYGLPSRIPNSHSKGHSIFRLRLNWLPARSLHGPRLLSLRSQSKTL